MDYGVTAIQQAILSVQCTMKCIQETLERKQAPIFAL